MIEKHLTAREQMLDQNKLLKYVARWTEPPATIIIISFSCLIAGGVSAAIVVLCLL